jgi:hypothetical protein
LRSQDIFQFTRFTDGDGGGVLQEEKGIGYLIVNSLIEELSLQMIGFTIRY